MGNNTAGFCQGLAPGGLPLPFLPAWPRVLAVAAPVGCGIAFPGQWALQEVVSRSVLS